MVAHTSGWPSQVLPVHQRAFSKWSAMVSLAITAPTGSAEPLMPLPAAIRSGFTPGQCM